MEHAHVSHRPWGKMSNLFRIAAGVVCALGLSLAPLRATAANLIVNGTFDAGVSSWTPIRFLGDACSYGWSSLVKTGMTDGHAYAYNMGSYPQRCGFYQEVTIPANTINRLTVSLGSDFNGAGSANIGRLEIRDTSNEVLQTLYSHDGSQGGSDPVSVRGPYNLDAYAGQTIRVFFFTRHGPGGYAHRIDNVVLDSQPVPPIPTMSEWAMILLGTILVGGSALYLQRRRRTT